MLSELYSNVNGLPTETFDFVESFLYSGCITSNINVADIVHTVRKMDLILRSIQRRPQMQFSMARRFKLQLLRRYSVKFPKMRKFTLGSP